MGAPPPPDQELFHSLTEPARCPKAGSLSVFPSVLREAGPQGTCKKNKAQDNPPGAQEKGQPWPRASLHQTGLVPEPVTRIWEEDVNLLYHVWDWPSLVRPDSHGAGSQ